MDNPENNASFNRVDASKQYFSNCEVIDTARNRGHHSDIPQGSKQKVIPG